MQRIRNALTVTPFLLYQSVTYRQFSSQVLQVLHVFPLYINVVTLVTLVTDTIYIRGEI